MSTEIAVQSQTDLERTAERKLLSVLTRNKDVLSKILPKHLDEKKFGWMVVNAVRTNPRLLEVSPASFLNCVVVASQMGLEIRKDQAYLVPFGKECQLLIDYKGKLELARRSGQVGGIQAVTIYANDPFTWRYGPHGVDFSHEPKFFGDRGPIMGFYAFAQITGGFVQFKEPMSLSEIDALRCRGRNGAPNFPLAKCLTGEAQQLGFRDPNRTPWTTDFVAMALKTVLHRLCKALPLTPELQLSQDVDEANETGATINVIDNLTDITDDDHKPIVQVEARTFDEWKGGKRDEVAARRIEEVKATGSLAKIIMDIRAEKSRLKTKWLSILGEQGFEDPMEIKDEALAVEILHQMQMT